MTEILGDQGSLLCGGHPFLAVLLSEHREQKGGVSGCGLSPSRRL